MQEGSRRKQSKGRTLGEVDNSAIHHYVGAFGELQASQRNKGQREAEHHLNGKTRGLRVDLPSRLARDSTLGYRFLAIGEVEYSGARCQPRVWSWSILYLGRGSEGLDGD